MLILENIRLALISVKANKMRSLLTMLGIIIGIGSVIAIMTVSSSLTSSINSTFQSMGANNITLGLQEKEEEEETNSSGMTFGTISRTITMDEDDYVTDEMLEDFSSYFSDSIDAISISESVGSGTVESGENSASITITGVNSGYFESDDVDLTAGRYITDADNEGEKGVIMVSDIVVDNIFDGDTSSAIGAEITVNVDSTYYTYHIIGVYEYDSDGELSEESTSSTTTAAYIPVMTGKAQTHADEGYSQFTVITSTTVSDVDTLASNMENYLNLAYYQDNEDYEIASSTLSTLTESLTSVVSQVSLAIAFIAGISLLVGGIGVMNIMLVSITERTREIGTRKALGAKNSSIRLQFIVEAVVLCLIGGILGIVVGFGLGAIAASLLGYAASVPVSSVLVSVIFSMAIGVFFGYYPANKAAKLDPIEALRYE